MAKTLLKLAQAVSLELGLADLIFVVGNTDDNTKQLLAFLNAAGTDLMMEYSWQSLIKEYRFTTEYLSSTATTTSGSAVVTGISSTVTLGTSFVVSGAGIPQDTYILTVDSPTQVTMNRPATASGSVTLEFAKSIYNMPSDYYKMVPCTQWDKSKQWAMSGPTTAQGWQQLKSSLVAPGIVFNWRILGKKFQIWPVTAAADYLGFEYVSENWVTSNAGATQSEFLADTDTCVYHDRVIITYTKLKWAESKGLDTTSLTRDFVRSLGLSEGGDSSSGVINMASPRGRGRGISNGWGNIPESGWGQ